MELTLKGTGGPLLREGFALGQFLSGELFLSPRCRYLAHVNLELTSAAIKVTEGNDLLF